MTCTAEWLSLLASMKSWRFHKDCNEVFANVNWYILFVHTSLRRLVCHLCVEPLEVVRSLFVSGTGL